MRDLREGIDDASDDESFTVETAKVTATFEIPAVVSRVLASPDGPELIEAAKMLDAGSKVKDFIVFHTPVGDIRCGISWTSCDPRSLPHSEKMFFVKMRMESMMFSPKPGAVFDVSFSRFNSLNDTIRVVCLSEPLTLYPGVDLLCFMPHTAPVEKNGKLNVDAPSVVSGNPSNATVNGEPVIVGEAPLEATTNMPSATAPAADYDRPRS